MPKMISSPSDNLSKLVGKRWLCTQTGKSYEVIVSDIADMKVEKQTGTGIYRTEETEIAVLPCPCGKGVVHFDLDNIGSRDESAPRHVGYSYGAFDRP